MKSVYTGGEKVAEFERYDELRVGDNKPAFIYEGSELVYPNPVKDGLVLWYDFSGRTNADGQRGIAEDLSGNGNHGTLQNFNYTAESGYNKNKLLFDGVDDVILTNYLANYQQLTISMTHANLASLSPGQKIIEKDGTTSDRSWSIRKTAHGFRVLIWEDNATGFTDLYPAADITEDSQIVVVYAHEGIYLYVNGNLVRNNETRGTGLSFSNIDVRIMGGSFLYSTKIYNRPLSPEEIAHNYAIEKERFGIE